jgi:hypothetical protein
MGTIDEHWCTLCRKTLDKAKDKYIDFELIHQAAAPVIKTWKKPKGLICMECVEKDEKLKAILDAILKAGNPVFLPEITCLSRPVCATYQPTSKPNVTCRHIAVIGDMVYCKRSHPGSVKLMVERGERFRYEMKLVQQFIRKACKTLPEPGRAAAEGMLQQALGGVWIQPSQVVKAVPRELAGGAEMSEVKTEKLGE